MNSLKMAGTTALITGGARRIGRACALALAKEGVNVVVHYRHAEAEARMLCRELAACGVKAWSLSADLTSPAEAESLFERTVAQAGPIDLLLNNASTYRASQLPDVSVQELTENLRLHGIAPLLLGRRLAAQKREGTIINFLDARVAAPATAGYAAYLLSKKWLLTLTQAMAVEMAPLVRVNAVAPGAILPPDGSNPEYFAAAAQANPLKKTGTVEEVVGAVLYLIGARFVTGQVLFVDGGYHLRGILHE